MTNGSTTGKRDQGPGSMVKFSKYGSTKCGIGTQTRIPTSMTGRFSLHSDRMLLDTVMGHGKMSDDTLVLSSSGMRSVEERRRRVDCVRVW